MLKRRSLEFPNELNSATNMTKTSSCPSMTRSEREVHVERAPHTNTIVHMGVGNFFKSHQLSYMNDLVKGGCKDWVVIGLGVLKTDKLTKYKMKKNNYNYNLLAIDSAGKTCIEYIQVLSDVLNSHENLKETILFLVQDSVKIVTLTITEVGYSIQLNQNDIELVKRCIGCGDADLKVDDLQNISAFGILIAALGLRFSRNKDAFTILSCDNLISNGHVTKDKCLREVQGLSDFQNWIHNNVRFPNTMVDRITPQLSVNEIKILSKDHLLIDHMPVVCEKYKMWIIEDDFVNGQRPEWDKVGAKFVQDVRPYELMKVSILNVTHQYIAYIGLNRDFEFVHDVFTNDDLHEMIRRFIFEDVVPTINDYLKKNQIDCEQFANDVVTRFQNVHMKDKLVRIALDGLEKFKQHSVKLILSGLEKNFKMSHFRSFVNEMMIYENITKSHEIFQLLPPSFFTI